MSNTIILKASEPLQNDLDYLQMKTGLSKNAIITICVIKYADKIRKKEKQLEKYGEV